MRRRFAHAEPEQSLRDAAATMRLARLRHLPVLRDRLLVGLISQRDILEHALGQWIDAGGAPREIEAQVVKQLMVSDVEWVDAGTPLADAVRRMLSQGIGCLPVVERGPDGPVIAGIVTESDFLRAAYASRGRRAPD